MAVEGFTDNGFTDNGFVTISDDLSKPVSFLYNSSQAGTSFSKDRVEITDTIINVKIQ